MPPLVTEINILRERYEFYSRKQKAKETLEDFVEDIHRLAQFCQFGSDLDCLVRDHILFGLKDKKISKAIVEEGGNPSTQEVIALCQALSADQIVNRRSQPRRTKTEKFKNGN